MLLNVSKVGGMVSWTFNSTITVQCRTGYTVNGSTSIDITCTNTGHWTNETATCERKYTQLILISCSIHCDSYRL